jgi:hypothetical protein
MQEKIKATRAPIRNLKELVAVTEKHEVTHREIYDRLMAVEQKVDKIETNTEGMVAAFQAAQGAFTVLEWMAKVAKPLLIVVAFMTALTAAWTHIKIK